MSVRNFGLFCLMLALAARAACAEPAGATPPSGKMTPEQTPVLWAVYYAWYQTADGPHKRSSLWTWHKSATQPAAARSQAQPLIGCYDSDDPAVVRWHIQLAQAAGIEAFLVSWWGGANLSGKAFETTILPIAAQQKFKVALCSELAQFHHDLPSLVAATASVLKRVRTSSAYLHVEGKPLVYLYQVPFDPKLTPATFEEFRRRVEGEAGPVCWMMDKIGREHTGRQWIFPEPWLKSPQIAMIGFYGTFSVERIWTYDDLAPHYARLAAQARAAGKKVFLPVHPGHDNSGFRPDDHFIIPRDDGATLRGYLRAVKDAGAEVALVTSFNEWPETTVVEPSSSWADPYMYLKILAEYKRRRFAPPPLPRRPGPAAGAKADVLEKPTHAQAETLPSSR